MFFDNEIDFIWCLGITKRCTPSEAIGSLSVILFYASVLIVSAIHISVIHSHDNHNVTTGNGRTSRRHVATTSNDAFAFLIALVVYFFTLAGGCLLWVLNPASIRPFHIWQVQLLGSTLLFACLVLFVIIHIDMGDSWYPLPDAPPKLVTHGIFQYARHPMYAVFLWASIATLLATLNWVIAWCVFGLVIVTLPRIQTEERILVDLFGDRYVEYRRRVSALGPPWQCLGFDKELIATQQQQHSRSEYREID